jgi:hypothetical protein
MECDSIIVTIRFIRSHVIGWVKEPINYLGQLNQGSWSSFTEFSQSSANELLGNKYAKTLRMPILDVFAFQVA